MPSHFRINGLGHAGDAAKFEGEGDKRRAKFSFAVNEGKDVPPSWYYVTAWGKTAENCSTIQKGDLIEVEGRGKMDQYTDRDGNKRTEFRVTASWVDNFSEWRRRKDNTPPEERDRVVSERFGGDPLPAKQPLVSGTPDDEIGF